MWAISIELQFHFVYFWFVVSITQNLWIQRLSSNFSSLMLQALHPWALPFFLTAPKSRALDTFFNQYFVLFWRCSSDATWHLFCFVFTAMDMFSTGFWLQKSTSDVFWSNTTFPWRALKDEFTSLVFCGISGTWWEWVSFLVSVYCAEAEPLLLWVEMFHQLSFLHVLPRICFLVFFFFHWNPIGLLILSILCCLACARHFPICAVLWFILDYFYNSIISFPDYLFSCG